MKTPLIFLLVLLPSELNAYPSQGTAPSASPRQAGGRKQQQYRQRGRLGRQVNAKRNVLALRIKGSVSVSSMYPTTPEPSSETPRALAV